MNVAPPVDENILINVNPNPDWINPALATGIAVIHNTIAMGILGPYLSHNGPIINLMNPIAGKLAMIEFQISFFVKPKESRISDSSGERQYVHIPDIKYEIHAK